MKERSAAVPSEKDTISGTSSNCTGKRTNWRAKDDSRAPFSCNTGELQQLHNGSTVQQQTNKSLINCWCCRRWLAGWLVGPLFWASLHSLLPVCSVHTHTTAQQYKADLVVRKNAIFLDPHSLSLSLSVTEMDQQCRKRGKQGNKVGERKQHRKTASTTQQQTHKQKKPRHTSSTVQQSSFHPAFTKFLLLIFSSSSGGWETAIPCKVDGKLISCRRRWRWGRISRTWHWNEKS